MGDVRDEMIIAATKLKEYCNTEECDIHCPFYNGKSEYGFPKCNIGDPHEWKIKKRG